jgi:ribonuclease P/MRP protein subunit RPP40
VPCGVPQGSVLGPRLFLVYINDILRSVNSNLLLFADDAKIWRWIYSPDDCDELQRDLNSLHRWSVSNSLPFNVQKCHVLSVHHKNLFEYRIGGVLLQRNSQERDLGILVQDNLNWSSQCRQANKKAFRQLGILRRAFGSFEPHLFSKLYSTYIRPHLEYAAQVCSPWLKRDKQLLEQPLRRATKFVRGYWNIPYPMRLRLLGIYSACYRRLRGDLIMMFHIIKNEDHPCRELLKLSTTTNLRGHHFKISHQQSHLNCRRFFFSLRICNVWNSLPEEIVSATSLTVFKKRLDTFMGDRCFSIE